MTMTPFERFRLKMGTNDNKREEQRKQAKYVVDELIADDPSFRPVIERIGKIPIAARLNRYVKEGFLQPKMSIQATMENPFFLGDLFHVDDRYWLCTAVHSEFGIHYVGEIIQCNHLLKFQLPGTDGQIWGLHAVVERPYSKNVTNSEIIQTSVTEFRIRLQRTPESERLFLNQRFILGVAYTEDGKKIPEVYYIASKDTISNSNPEFDEGFLILNTVRSESIFVEDNLDVMVANYRPPVPEPVPTPDYADIYAPSFEVKYGGSWRTFSGKVFNSAGEDITTDTNLEFDWRISATDLQAKYLEIEFVTDYDCRIRCRTSGYDPDDKELLYSTFELVLSAKNLDDGTEYGEVTKSIYIGGLL